MTGAGVRRLVAVRFAGMIVAVRDPETGEMFHDRCDECGRWLASDDEAGHDCEVLA
jgi:hypothetical protein